MPFSRGSFQPKDQTEVSFIAGRFLPSEPPGSPRPFRYDLNQIPYDYTVEVTNKFKGLDLIECLKIYGQRFVTCREGGKQNHPQEEEIQNSKMVV